MSETAQTLVCPGCGHENPEAFRLCGMCGTPLADRGEQRKVATVLFCDMSGSTAMGERLDAESVRAMMFRYFHEMRGAIERHGGTVEKFVGDAVMAVFGVPIAHEDDALRALRAASEMRDRLAALNSELESQFGATIALRIGVNTGEVVAGDATARQMIVTGDPVNVAARLEQAAAPDEILIGELTRRLAGDQISAEAVPPLPLKGKAAPLPAHRLLAVQPHKPAPLRERVRMVGRAGELAVLRDHLEQALASRILRLVTIVGEAGVGKSRLAAEFERTLAGVHVLRGRCLSYGEGITYSPLVEIVTTAAGILDEDTPDQARDRIARLVAAEADGGAIARTIARAFGLEVGLSSPGEIAWASRRLLDTLARDRPLAVFIDDLQWAEAPLLDLVADLPEAVSGAPILVTCLTRPELLETRPEWECTIRLEPLDAEEAGELASAALGSASLPERTRARLVAAAGGNPLFLEELVAMLIENGDATDLTIPPTLSALLAARLDRLDPVARAAAERGAIEGEVFHRGAVAALMPEEARPSVRAAIETLARKDVVHSAKADFVDEAAFRFRHILIRDAVYNGTPKRVRSMLHERFAEWLAQKAGDRLAEYDAILGLHLDQAFRLRAELGPVGDPERALASRAADRLRAAGRMALNRGDVSAAAKLLGRAYVLLGVDDPRVRRLVPDLVSARADSGDLPGAQALVDEIVAVRTASDDPLAATARVLLAELKLVVDPEGWSDRALKYAEHAIRVLEPEGDDLGLAHAWYLIQSVHWLRGQLADCGRAAEQQLVHAQRSGDLRLQAWARSGLIAARAFGGEPVEQTQRAIEEELEWARSCGSRWHEGMAHVALAVMGAARGQRADVSAHLAEGNTILEDVGMPGIRASLVGNWAPLVIDEPEALERELRSAYESLVELGDRSFGSEIAAQLADAVYVQDRYDETLALLVESEQAAASDDVYVQVDIRRIRAKLLARTGDHAGAERLAHEAVALADEQEFVDARAAARRDLAEVLLLTGRPGHEEAAREAIAIWEAKGNVRMATGVRRRVAELEATRTD